MSVWSVKRAPCTVSTSVQGPLALVTALLTCPPSRATLGCSRPLSCPRLNIAGRSGLQSPFCTHHPPFSLWPPCPALWVEASGRAPQPGCELAVGGPFCAAGLALCAEGQRRAWRGVRGKRRVWRETVGLCAAAFPAEGADPGYLGIGLTHIRGSGARSCCHESAVHVGRLQCKEPSVDPKAHCWDFQPLNVHSSSCFRGETQGETLPASGSFWKPPGPWTRGQ